jgi:hypothetical protein
MKQRWRRSISITDAEKSDMLMFIIMSCCPPDCVGDNTRNGIRYSTNMVSTYLSSMVTRTAVSKSAMKGGSPQPLRLGRQHAATGYDI